MALPNNSTIYRTQNWEDEYKRARFGSADDLTRKQERQFNRYARSKKGEAARIAYDKAEMDKFNQSVDRALTSRKEAMQKAATDFTASITSPSAPVVEDITPALVLKDAVRWNQVANQYGFKDYNAVAAWQKKNGLTVDGKFGAASYAKWAQLNPDKVGSAPVIKPKAIVTTPPQDKTEVPVYEVTSTPSGYVELSRQDGSTFLQRIPSKTTTTSATSSKTTPKKRNNWFVNATLGAAMADTPAVMTASGWRQNEVGDYVQDRADDPAVEKLRNNLAILGGTATGITTAGLMTAGAAGTAAIAAPEATPLLTGPAAKHFLYDAAGKLLMAYKQGGTMNRINYFQQGGAAPQQQDIKAQVTALVQAAMQGDKKAVQTVNQIMEAAKAGDPQATQIAQLMEQVIKQMQGQATAAKWGSKLNYIRSLKFAKGGKACPECEKAKQVEMKACGGKKAKKRYFGGLV